MIAALAMLGVVSLFKSMQVQSARVTLMRTLDSQLAAINPAELKQPCELKALSQNWQQLRQSSATIDTEFAFVLQDSAAKNALSNLQATIGQAPSCSTLTKQWRTLEESCDQCHRAIRGANTARPTRAVSNTDTAQPKIQ